MWSFVVTSAGLKKKYWKHDRGRCLGVGSILVFIQEKRTIYVPMYVRMWFSNFGKFNYKDAFLPFWWKSQMLPNTLEERRKLCEGMLLWTFFTSVGTASCQRIIRVVVVVVVVAFEYLYVWEKMLLLVALPKTLNWKKDQQRFLVCMESGHKMRESAKRVVRNPP